MIIIKKIMKIIGVLILISVLFFIIGYIITSGDYQVERTAADNKELKTINLNGGIFQYETHGNKDNPVVIVVHGGPGADYRSLLSLSKLKDDYFVVFYNQRSTGLSPRQETPDGLTYGDSLKDLDAFVEHFSNGKQVNLIGHSFGGTIVSTYIGENHEKVNAVILAEPGPLNNQMGEIGPNLTKTSAPQYLKALFESFHIKNPPDSQARFDYVTKQMMLQANSGYWCEESKGKEETWRYGYLAYKNIIDSFYDSKGDQINAIESIEKYNKEVMFLVSSCNTVIGEEFQREQMKYFNHASLAIVEESGHSMFLEKPDESFNIVKQYLDRMNIQ
jgi:proline iminopeptidase